MSPVTPNKSRADDFIGYQCQTVRTVFGLTFRSITLLKLPPPANNLNQEINILEKNQDISQYCLYTNSGCMLVTGVVWIWKYFQTFQKKTEKKTNHFMSF